MEPKLAAPSDDRMVAWTASPHDRCSKRLRARRQAGIDDGDRAAGVAGVLGGEKRNGGSDLLRGGGAFERQRLEQVAPVLRIAGAVLRLLPHQVDQALGCYRPGADRCHRTPSRTLTLPSDWVKAVSAALPVTPQI